MDPRGGAPRIWLIGGPTASGKTALALRLAAGAGAEIVNADSMQLYADLRILSARPGPDEEARAPHHLFGAADAGEAWSAGRWLRAVTPILKAIEDRGRPAVVVGGTGLYFSALTRGLADQPPASPAARAEAETLFDALGEAGFRERLALFDAEAVARIAPRDRQRLVRLCELKLTGGAPPSDSRRRTRPTLAPGSWRGVALTPPRETLYARCDARLEAMIAAGALDEVRALLARGLPPGAPAMKALGVRELAAHLEGRTSLEAALAEAQQATRRYAKRQMTWFRTQAPDWPHIDAETTEDQWRDFERLRGAR